MIPAEVTQSRCACSVRQVFTLCLDSAGAPRGAQMAVPWPRPADGHDLPRPDQLDYRISKLPSCSIFLWIQETGRGPLGRLDDLGMGMISEEGRKCLLGPRPCAEKRRPGLCPKGLRVYHLYFISSLPTLHSLLTWPCPGLGLPISLGPPQ